MSLKELKTINITYAVKLSELAQFYLCMITPNVSLNASQIHVRNLARKMSNRSTSCDSKRQNILSRAIRIICRGCV